MASLSTHVLVVDDYEQWRVFLVSFLTEMELQVVTHASDGLEAVQKAGEFQPAVIVLDIGLPKLNGIEAARQIRAVSPRSKILFLSENRSADIVQEAMRIGAVGFVVKSDAAHDLGAAIKTILGGEQFLSTSLAKHAVETLAHNVSQKSWGKL